MPKINIAKPQAHRRAACRGRRKDGKPYSK